MAQSPLYIEGYTLSKLEWNENSEVVLDTEKKKLDQQFEVLTGLQKHPTEEGRWRVALDVNSVDTGDSNPISFKVTYTGYFRVNEGFPAENAEQLVAVNGSSILFAAAREMLMLLSGRSTHGAFILPSVSFIDIQLSTTTSGTGADPASDEENPDSVK
jgi:preprotein translocase subunit SecB